MKKPTSKMINEKQHNNKQESHNFNAIDKEATCFSIKSGYDTPLTNCCFDSGTCSPHNYLDMNNNNNSVNANKQGSQVCVDLLENITISSKYIQCRYNYLSPRPVRSPINKVFDN